MQPSKKPISYAFCGFYSIDISMETDVTQVQLNEKSKKHCSSLKSISSRSTFLSIAGFLLINAGSKRKILSIEDQVAKAEIFGAWTLFVGNKTKRWISKWVLMKTKHAKFSEKLTFLSPWYAHLRTWNWVKNMKKSLQLNWRRRIRNARFCWRRKSSNHVFCCCMEKMFIANNIS